MHSRKLSKLSSESAEVYYAVSIKYVEDRFIGKCMEIQMQPRFSYNYLGLKFA
jgi:hypothetical protein